MNYFRIIRIALVRVCFVVASMMLVGSASILYAASELPYTFSPGQNISSAQVNANFQTLADQIAALQAQLAPASIVGTYDYFSFGTGMDVFPGSTNSDDVYTVKRNSYRGTLVFSANGTVAINGTGAYTYMRTNGTYPVRWYVDTDTSPDIGTTNYTVSGTTVSFSNAIGTLSADGTLLVLKYSSSNTTGITIGIRRQ